MGYFAVLAAPDGPSFSPVKCHVNLWALAGAAPGRRLWYLDVGLDIQAHDVPLTAIQLLLPVDIEVGGHADLFDALSSQDVLELVFGGPVDLSTDRAADVQRLRGAGIDLECARIDAPNVEYHNILDRHSSLITVPLQRPVPPAERRYVRMRFRVFGMGPTWRWRGPLLARTGGRLDLRVSDVRESRSAVGERMLRDRVLPIDNLFVFVMLPNWLRPALANPDLAYVRTLESGAWTEYLKGAPHLGRADGLVVHYWKHVSPARDGTGTGTPPGAITADNPFRGFLDVERPSAAHGWWFYARVAIAVLIALLAAGPGLDLVRDVDLPSPSLSWFKLLVGTTVVGIVAAIALLTHQIQTRARRIRLIIRTVERWVLARVGHS